MCHRRKQAHIGRLVEHVRIVVKNQTLDAASRRYKRILSSAERVKITRYGKGPFLCESHQACGERW